MGDTVIFGKTVSGVLKGACLYVLVDICIGLGQAMMEMDQARWSQMWWMQKSAFWLMQIGSAGLILKAYYSKTAKQS